LTTPAVNSNRSIPKSSCDKALASFDLTKDVKEAILKALEELEAQDYWEAIQQATSERLARLVEEGIEEGLNQYDLTKRINEALGGMAKSRAAAIARTETTGAFNAGHQAAFTSLGDQITGKIWLAVMDEHTRESHAALNGKLVAVDGEFDIGGRFPGEVSLPPEDRINCRCTVVAAFPE